MRAELFVRSSATISIFILEEASTTADLVLAEKLLFTALLPTFCFLFSTASRAP